MTRPGHPPPLFVPDPILSLRGVAFRYRGRRELFRDLDCDFAPGVTLLLGPNGAGKSTLLSLAASAVPSREGEVRHGDVVAHGGQLKRYRRDVAWLPQSVAAVPNLSSREQVAYFGWLKGMSRPDAWDAAARALAEVGLSDEASTPLRKLSGGQQRRVGIAQTLVHDAQVLLMDEPTAGLDPLQRRSLYEVMARLRENRSLIVSTHQTEDLAAVFDHVVVLAEGKVRFIGTSAAFLALGATEPEGPARVVAAYERALDPTG